VIDANLKISGASKVYFEEEGEGNILIFTSGASKAYVNSSESISVEASSASGIFYYGNGQVENFDISSAASLKNINKQ
tara:strand:- start:229 stop:462 length:234 start_codon:yes stop_codon:yes gene_type:complete